MRNNSRLKDVYKRQFLSKSWNNISRTGYKFNQAVIDRYGAGIIGGARGEELWVKSVSYTHLRRRRHGRFRRRN